MNPPYSQKTKTESELSFIKNSLDLIEKNGKLVAIVPMSCAIEMSAIKIDQRRNILLYHRLDAVFSMPDDLFYPVGTCTCIMVFTAHVPHGKIASYKEVKNKKTTTYDVIQGDRPTYFGYWKDDGFKKTKINGRCDKDSLWNSIKHDWLLGYRSGEVENGKSAKEFVNERMEWCCEAYMNVDYSEITEKDFEQEIKKYLAFSIMNIGDRHETL